MSQLFTNNASATLSVQAEIIDTTITLQTNEGQLFPNPTGSDFFQCTLEDTSGNIEIVQCTGRGTPTSDDLTVVRAQESTVAKVFPTGSKVELRPTAGTHDSFLQIYGGVMQGELDMNNEQITDPLVLGGEIRNAPIRGTDGGTANEIIVPTAGGTPTLGANEIWHAGNDGVGSGLDADTFQTLSPTAFIRPADDPVSPTGDWNHSGDVVFTGDVDINGPVTTSGEGTGGTIQDGDDNTQPLGFNVIPYNLEEASSYTLVLSRNGQLLERSNTSAVDYVCPNDATIPIGATYIVVNSGASGLFRIKGDTGVSVIHHDGGDGDVTTVAAGNGFTLDVGSVVTIYKQALTVWYLWGSGITTSA